MPSERWRPLSIRQNGKAEEYDALHEGVPKWLESSLMRWVQEYFIGTKREPVIPAIDFIERALHIDLNDPLGSNRGRAHEHLLIMMHNRPELFLDVIDFSLFNSKRAGADELEFFLQQAGSAWTVAPDHLGLTRRVLPEIQEAVKVEVDRAGEAGALLAEAWRHVYGRSPNASEGYHTAVRAIESASIAAVSPNDGKGTLGRVIGELRANRLKFGTAFVESADGFDAVVNLMDVVWRSHHDRHGKPEESKSMSSEEAEAAVHAALLLVHYFRVATIHRTPQA